MGISDYAIDRPRLVILGAIMLCVMGLAAALSIPKEREPRVRIPIIVATVPNPGAQPATNEREIIRKIEDAIGSVSHLKERGGVVSEAVSGAANFIFTFEDSVNVADARHEIESLFNRVKGQFPAEAQKDPGPIVKDIAFEDWPVIQIFLAGGKDGFERRRIADRLKKQIGDVQGVSGVDVFGGLEEEIHIELNPHLMALYGFTHDQVEMAVRRGNVGAPSGSIETAGGSDTRVDIKAKFADVTAIADLPVGLSDGKPIRLGDIAAIERGHKSRTTIARYGSEDAVVLLARGKTDIDVLATANAVQAAVDRFVTNGENAGLHVGTVRSQAREIGYMFDQLGGSAIFGTLVVLGILWIAFGWRNAAIMSLAMPMAILATGAMMWVAKRSIAPDLAINKMTLFAIILVIGMVVDGCIIVGENIYRFRELGYTPVLAAKRGVQEISSSLNGAYLTTFAAFAPMYLVRGIMGDYMSLLPTVVLFALCAALLVDHFLLPVLTIYVLKVSNKQKKQHGSLPQSETDEPLTPEQIEIRNAERVAQSTVSRRVYGGLLESAFAHRKLVIAVTLALAFTPIALFYQGSIGVEFFPETDKGVIEINFELPLGASMEKKTARVAATIEAAVNKAVRPDEWLRPSAGAMRVQPVTTIGNPQELNTRLDMASGSGPEFGMVYVELEPAGNRKRSAAQIRKAIEKAIPPMPGVIVRLSSPSEGPPAGAPVMVRVLAQTDTPLDDLAIRAGEIEQLLRSTPGVYDVTNDYRLQREYSITPNRTIAQMFDVDTAQIATAVNAALEGRLAGKVDFGAGKDIDLRIRNAPGDRDQLSDLKDLPIRSATGKVITVDQVSDVKPMYSPNVMRHYDGRRVINIRAELESGVSIDDVKMSMIRALRPELSEAEQFAVVTERGNRAIASDDLSVIEFGGELELRDDAMADLTTAMIISCCAILVLLTVQFNSFIQPLIVLLSIPLSLVGVSIGLVLCGFPFSVTVMIGIVALSGIVVNDAIVLVDFINKLSATGIPLRKALIYASQMRMRPIFLTTITTIGGLMPLSLNLSGGGEFWQPLAVTMMFGLGFATLQQLFVIPLLCYMLSFNFTLLDPMKRVELAGEQVITA
ncbi:MAG: efflux RND transporter permease subunit [Phycisphaeraceae bacterium]